MKKLYYDLHIHSCLSPCGDNDNTPNNIAGMAHLCGLDIVALTDHNTARNCPAFFKAAEKYDIIPIAGMELTTSEDIHLVCLFEKLEDALLFDVFVDENRFKIKNKPELFGRQLVLDENDEPVAEIESLLINATNISINDAYEVVEKYGGICYPAHIDRESNGVIAILGSLPQDAGFKIYELRDENNIKIYSKLYNIESKDFVIGSDAHYLTDIKDKKNHLEFEDELVDKTLIKKRLFEILRRNRK